MTEITAENGAFLIEGKTSELLPQSSFGIMMFLQQLELNR